MTKDGRQMEHILLTSDPNHSLESAAHVTQRKFFQASELKGYRAAYELFNGHYLEIQITGRHRKSIQYTVDLGFLDPTPIRLRTIDWPLLGAAVGLLAATLLLSVYIRSSAMSALENPWFPMVILLGAGACAVTLIGLYRSSDKILFYSQHGKIPLVVLLNGKPTKPDFQDFLQDLVQCIHDAQQRFYSSARERLAAELREHRRLKDKAIIAADAYEAVKNRILRKY